MGNTTQVSVADWRQTVETNLTSAFLAAKYQIPALLSRGGGSIVFTSTFVGYTAGLPGMSAYAAGKAGLIGLTQVLAAEFGARRIRVNAILPGATDTPMDRAVAGTAEARAFVQSLHALKRRSSARSGAPAARAARARRIRGAVPSESSISAWRDQRAATCTDRVARLQHEAPKCALQRPPS